MPALQPYRYETTSSTLSGTLSLLASKPEAQARAHKEIDSVLRGKVGAALQSSIVSRHRRIGVSVAHIMRMKRVRGLLA